MLRETRVWVASLAVGLLLGCQPRLPDVDAYGHRVAVGSETEVELCAGTLRAFDEHVVFIEEELGIVRPQDNPLNVFIVDDTAPWCRDVEACYIGGWVDATFVPSAASESVWHELVHQVVAGSTIGMTDRFLSEGLASALGDDWCPPPTTGSWPTTPLPQLLGKSDVAFGDYPRGAAFVDFVRASYGTDSLVELAACIDRGDPLTHVESCFQRVFERSVAAVGREFELAATEHHPNPALCRGPVERWSGPVWTRDVALACDDPETVNTFGSPHAREVDLLLEIPNAGWYEILVAGDGAVRVDLEPCFCASTGSTLFAEPGGTSVWIGEAGTHRVVVATDDPSVALANIMMTPSSRELAPPL